MSFLLGIFAFIWYFIFAVQDALPPECWREAIAACGLRNPIAVLPGVSRFVLEIGHEIFGRLHDWSALAGAIMTALSVIMFYRNIRRVIEIHGNEKYNVSEINQLIYIIPTILFAISIPVVISAESVSSDSLTLFTMQFAFTLFFRYLARGGTFTGLIMILIMGMNSAENPFALILSVFCQLAIFSDIWTERAEKQAIINGHQPMIKRKTFRRLAVLVYITGLAVTIAGYYVDALNYETLKDNFFEAYTYQYTKDFLQLADIRGWLMFAFAIIAPWLLAVSTQTPSPFFDKHHRLIRIAQILAGVIAFFVLCQTNIVGVQSHFMALMCMLFSAITLALALNALLAGKEPRSGAIVSLCLLPLCAWPFGRYQIRYEMREVVNYAIRAMITEIDNAEFLFTDGILDEGLELTGGRIPPLRCLNMVDEHNDYARYLRLRCAFNEEDRRLLEISSVKTFCDWVIYRPEQAAKAAYTSGLSLWQTAGRLDPVIGGFVARIMWAAGRSAESGIADAKKLAQRILDICNRYDLSDRQLAGEQLNYIFDAINWRISKMAMMRGDSELAWQLNAVNEHLDFHQNNDMNIENFDHFDVANRAKLHFAIHQADFSTAAELAHNVLEKDPKNGDAHFALGMHHYLANNHEVAEKHLRTALESKPEDGNIWNNLSMCQLALGKLEDAEFSAMKAIELLPGSTNPSNTLLHIEKLKQLNNLKNFKKSTQAQ